MKRKIKAIESKKGPAIAVQCVDAIALEDMAETLHTTVANVSATELEKDRHRFKTVKRKINAIKKVQGPSHAIQRMDDIESEDIPDKPHPAVANVSTIATDGGRHKNKCKEGSCHFKTCCSYYRTE